MVHQQARKIGKGVNHAKMLFIFCSFVCFFLSGCKSNDTRAISYAAVEHSAEIARIETAIVHYGNTIDATITDLTERAAATGATLDDLSKLLEEYFARVGDLLQQYRTIQDFVRTRAYLESDFETYSNSFRTVDFNPNSM